MAKKLTAEQKLQNQVDRLKVSNQQLKEDVKTAKAAKPKAKAQSLTQLLNAALKKADTAKNPRRVSNLIGRALSHA